MTAHNLITLTVSPSIEEALVDWLLGLETTRGFTSFPVHGHSSQLQGLSLAEQVAGRKKQVRFQIHLPERETAEFIARLQQDFQGTGLHYWISPVTESGHL
ncbi:DUF3240 family protein [Methylococcus sp. EFPC2]|uniref:DUF3240 family protein n=1 Tax=Methylococcus sp. EFPC2 TaxID=2812648 RepID=UPI001966FC7F|nr:DUF3240 family protein [Methylococcus sp. EFPC2]QSA96611.1 DUF3240 family protein [Methylococcus sp. EFPC2]